MDVKLPSTAISTANAIPWETLLAAPSVAVGTGGFLVVPVDDTLDAVEDNFEDNDDNATVVLVPLNNVVPTEMALVGVCVTEIDVVTLAVAGVNSTGAEVLMVSKTGKDNAGLDSLRTKAVGLEPGEAAGIRIVFAVAKGPGTSGTKVPRETVADGPTKQESGNVVTVTVTV